MYSQRQPVKLMNFDLTGYRRFIRARKRTICKRFEKVTSCSPANHLNANQPLPAQGKSSVTENESVNKVMAETQRQSLKRYIGIISAFNQDKIITELESVFINLQYLDQTKNIDLWLELRTALSKNKALHDDEVSSILADCTLAKDGYWWYSPEILKR